MGNILFQTICRIGIFTICAQAIVHFRPRESHEKYLKLLTGVMILLQLLLPAGSFFSQGGGGEAGAGLALFRESLERELEKTARDAAEAEALLERMTLREVRQRMEEGRASAGAGAQTEGQAASPAEDREGEDGAQTLKEAQTAGEVSEITVIVEPVKLESP